MFNKYVEQFYPSDEQTPDGSETFLSLFYNTAKFQNVDRSQTVASFLKQCEKDLGGNVLTDGRECDVQRLKKIQTFTILFLIMKKKWSNLKLKRAERGHISSITGEYILKADTLYFSERNNLWCIYLSSNDKLFYSFNILDLFHVFVDESLSSINV